MVPKVPPCTFLELEKNPTALEKGETYAMAVAEACLVPIANIKLVETSACNMNMKGLAGQRLSLQAHAT